MISLKLVSFFPSSPLSHSLIRSFIISISIIIIACVTIHRSTSFFLPLHFVPLSLAFLVLLVFDGHLPLVTSAHALLSFSFFFSKKENGSSNPSLVDKGVLRTEKRNFLDMTTQPVADFPGNKSLLSTTTSTVH
ncbi:hypothetical protein K435DRAFT_400448 [Dendrothele bispora CBS 962.96]|uniref:Transmembrane protein n=1 Tax=Dendrothele bispora (strain CBS 962.96) TaxID=1314807 RepID=A0A4S8L7E7_DENBC|nr:hypothetical protein K435DRAFT_400448 [Dendrothele bispora CBS 962.96]